jgi:cytochrome c
VSPFRSNIVNRVKKRNFFVGSVLCIAGSLSGQAQSSRFGVPGQNPGVLVAQAKGDAAKGKDVFDQCRVCHNDDSTETKVGPGLKSLFMKDKMANGKKPTDESVRARIREGGNGMPGFDESLLSKEDMDNLIAYLKSI